MFQQQLIALFKKKSRITPREDLMKILSADTLNIPEACHSFFLADAVIIRNTDEFNHINERRRDFHEDIGKSKHGKQWFQQAFEQYIKSLKTIKHFDTQLVKLDAYLSLYWYLCTQYPTFMEPVIEMYTNEIDPRIRRYYEKVYNIDIFTGLIYDAEVEKNNAWKEHFYKASFAFHEGKGDIDISMREWRTFLKEFMDHLSDRPRLIYDFAKEVVMYQKLFHFFTYAIKTEKMNLRRNDEIPYIDTLIAKMINAIYAVDEQHGNILRRLYA